MFTIHTYTLTYTYIHTHTQTKKHIHNVQNSPKLFKALYTRILHAHNIYIYIYIYIYGYTHTHKHAHTQTYTLVYARHFGFFEENACTYIHAHAHIRMRRTRDTLLLVYGRTHVHTYIHTCVAWFTQTGAANSLSVRPSRGCLTWTWGTKPWCKHQC